FPVQVLLRFRLLLVVLVLLLLFFPSLRICVGYISVFSRSNRHILHWCMGRMLGRTTVTLLITFPFPILSLNITSSFARAVRCRFSFSSIVLQKEKCREMPCSMYRLSHNTVHLVYHHYCSKTTRRHRRHRTTARRGHTPAAHGQSSSSPSLLSLACSLQHKPTPRQRRAETKRGDKSHSHAPSHPAMRVTHHNHIWMVAVQKQSKYTHKKRGALLARAPFLTLPQSLLQPFSLLRPSQHRQSVMRSRCIRHHLPQSNSSVSATSLTIAGMHRPQSTHNATTSCRLFPPIMSATPIAYLHTCPMRCNHPRIRAGRHARHLVVIPVL
ncbi:hypothetical protein MOQ_007514, partial [Trypanosoma cruzi marinkellei]